MVNRPKLVEPAQSCDICGKQFFQGDTAICVIKVPDAHFDTLCVEDWHTILKSSAAWLNLFGEVPVTPPETLVEALQTLLVTSDGVPVVIVDEA